jgi:hypothetical protein
MSLGKGGPVMIRLLSVLVVCLIWLSNCTQPPPPKPPPVFKLDHFKAYKVGVIKAERPKAIHVADQFFEPPPTSRITPDFIEYFATPVEKTIVKDDKKDDKDYKEEKVTIKDPLAHLAWYPILGQIVRPKTVTFVNQMTNFKENTINVELLRAILVPTEKKGEGFPKDLDHYLCWKVDPFSPGNQTTIKVTLNDPQFKQKVTVEAKGPLYFCNPCSKDYNEKKNKEDHLAI